MVFVKVQALCGLLFYSSFVACVVLSMILHKLFSGLNVRLAVASRATINLRIQG